MRLLDAVSAALGTAEPFIATRDALAAGADFTLAAPGLVRPVLTSALFAGRPRPMLVVVAGEATAERFARQAAAYLRPGEVLHFPERTDSPWSDEAPDLEEVGARARALHALSSGRPAIVISSTRALLRALPPQGSHVFEPLTLTVGATLDLEETIARLARMGYERVETAEARGSFAVRGGVLDVFPSDGTHPVRAELFGDEIETLRRYVPSTGQSIGDAGPTEVFGCREVVLGSRSVAAARTALRDRALREPEIAHHFELMDQGIYFNGIERYLPFFYKQAGVLTDYLAAETLVVVAEPRSLFDDATRRSEELLAQAEHAGVSADGLILPAARIELGGRQRLTLLALLRAGGVVDDELVARSPEVAGGEERFIAGVRALLSVDYGVALAVPERRVRNRVAERLVDEGIPVVDLVAEARERTADDPGAAGSARLRSGVVNLTDVEVPAGYVVPAARFAIVSIDDVYPRSAAARRAAREVDSTRITFGFAPGDYVVHATHGIALFKALERRVVLGAEREYLVLEYAKGDKLYVPVEQIDRVTKYVGSDGSAPRVTRLNTADWSRATGKARAAARKLAFDLVDLYARRASVAGHAFGSDTPWQLEMEAAFPYLETPDQLAAIADVKADMESEKPMDRLICGDVGYGKTEVAIRAAFKATHDGKQVLVLCPTTILAQQHFTTFSERFAAFPVRVEVLSRFRSPSQQKAALEGFASGEVDVLIGTHRLLSADVAPKDLGLVVIDEEQRFGVEHKEHLKNLREQIDVLTMTATPIPRTLQMSLSGVRDMSVIDTPPPNRFPVHVHVGEYDPDVVSGAIRREVQRGGQVYFVSNRVKSIDEAVARVTEAAPEARVGVAHGQMSERELERVMERFAANEIDVLVATTIVESGIDNPHSNTLIIEDSQRLGLAQLYQLKGRVGRSHVKAYAYFLFPRGASLTEQATERLVAIRDHSDLGSGIKVAMRDLEIRGAGSLLGAEQHGSMSAVGFDLYAEMIRQAVAEVRGEPVVAHPEIKVDLPVPAFLPEEYVGATDERVRTYRRLAGAPTVERVEQVARELADAHGALPEPARNLVDIARIRALAAEAGVRSVSVVRRRLTISPISPSERARGALAALGAITLERDRAVALPLGYGASVTDSAAALLGAILAGSDDA
ncbi:MAG: transcription-repair coupling factor [Anaerosomatales bacterium]|nr:transcription-repair coupling factor [Anaerosomatales bacterium]MDT8434143.1 transcription-repair coupling factor [Anaerosomatales bacterium]